MKIELIKAIDSDLDGVKIQETVGTVFDVQSTEDYYWIVDNGQYHFPVDFHEAKIVSQVKAGDKVRLYCQGSDEPSNFYGVVEAVRRCSHPYRPNRNGEYDYTYVAQVRITGDDIQGLAHGIRNGHVEFHNHERLIIEN